MFVVCEKWVETRTDCYIDPKFFSRPKQHFFLILARGCSTVDHWGPKALCLELVLPSASCLQLTQTVRAPGYIIFLRQPASAVLALIYTGASLDWRLGQGSIYNKWFQVFLSNTNNSIQRNSYICIQFNGFRYCYVIIIIKFNINHSFSHS